MKKRSLRIRVESVELSDMGEKQYDELFIVLKDLGQHKSSEYATKR